MFPKLKAKLKTDFESGPEGLAHLNPLLQHSGQSSLLDSVCQILDLAPENRKVSGAAMRVLALLGFCSLALLQVIARTSMRSIHFSLKNHPDSQSVLLHSVQIFSTIAAHDIRLWHNLGEILKVLLGIGAVVVNAYEPRRYLVLTIRNLAEGVERMNDKADIRRIGGGLVKMSTSFISRAWDGGEVARLPGGSSLCAAEMSTCFYMGTRNSWERVVLFYGWGRASGVAVFVQAFDTPGSVFLGSQLPSEGWPPSHTERGTRRQGARVWGRGVGIC